jgi:hypothetical protein
MKKDIDRAIKLFHACRKGVEALRQVEAEISLLIVGDDAVADDASGRETRAIEYRSLSDFEATTEVGNALARSLGGDASRFDIRICSESNFRVLWALRKIIDKTGISIPIYVDAGLDYLRKTGKRRVHPSMLARADVMLHVMHRYAEEVPSWRGAAGGEWGESPAV